MGRTSARSFSALRLSCLVFRAGTFLVGTSMLSSPSASSSPSSCTVIPEATPIIFSSCAVLRALSMRSLFLANSRSSFTRRSSISVAERISVSCASTGGLYEVPS